MLEEAIVEGEEASVIWAELAPGSQRAVVLSAPLDVVDTVGAVCDQFATRVLTGGTLTTGDGFDYIRDRLGLDGFDGRQYASPFRYGECARLFVPIDVPDPKADEYLGVLGGAIAALVGAAEGRTLALFTSKHTMQMVAELVRGQIESAGYRLVVQGIDAHASELGPLLKRERGMVAFGVDTMWTGIDVPGEALSQVIVTKLPFPAFTRPVQHARGEQYDDGFNQYSVPQAVIGFRQGFGRLIRSSGDRGVVVVLDSRLRRAGYGEAFLEALPIRPERVDTIDATAREVTAFLNQVALSS